MLSPKPKRGVTSFTIEGTGQVVYLERVKSATVYFVCDQPGSPLAANYFDVDVSTLSENKKAVTGLKTKPKVLTKAEKEFKKELNVFFASQTLVMPYLCENCNKPLYAFTAFEKRCTIAHILEKKKFKSVAIHPMNKLFLCAKGGCHAKFDNASAQERSEMPVYALAIMRYSEFHNLLTEPEKILAEKYLNIQ